MSGVRLSDRELIDWIRLIRSERVGPRTFRGLTARFGGVREALDALPEVLRQSGRAGLKIATVAAAEREMEGLARLGGRFVAQADPDYPRPLLATDTAPPLIAVRGTVEILARPCIAIVGSRNSSASGGAFTERLAAELGRAGYAIVSGLARGIDTRAHRAALPTGTVAVLAGGHDRVYPSENAGLLERLIDAGGAAVTEMPLGWEPRAQDFPRRNRIVSGLSYGTVVVEAARRSGSLITARLALEQGREVFAVPGSPLDPRAEGSNDLIRGGATLCAEADHVIGVIGPILLSPTGLVAAERRQPTYRGQPSPLSLFEDELWSPPPGGTSDEGWDEGAGLATGGDTERLLSLLGPSPVLLDELARQADLPIRSVQTALVELEMSNLVDRHAGSVSRRVVRDA